MSDSPDVEAREALESFRSQVASSGTALALVASLNEGIVERSGLDIRTFHLVRAAAMAASGSSSFSWDAQLEMMGDTATGAELLGVLTAIAPIIGTARYTTAVDNILSESH